MGDKMAIYAYKNAITNSIDFIKNVNKKEFIEGFILHVTMTKDNQIIGYTPTTANLSTEGLQASNLGELEGTTIEELSKLLYRIKDFKKRVIIYVMPLLSPNLSDATVKEINERNWYYIEKLKEILLPYPNLNISIASASNYLVTYMKQQINFLPVGRIISPLDLNYQEADFFVVPPTMLDAKIFKQEIAKNTEIMVEMKTANDMTLVFNFFGGNEEAKEKELFSKMQFISAHPELFYSIFKQKGFLS